MSELINLISTILNDNHNTKGSKLHHILISSIKNNNYNSNTLINELKSSLNSGSFKNIK